MTNNNTGTQPSNTVTPQPSPQPKFTDTLLFNCLIDFGLPTLIIIVCLILLLTGKDDEVKSILAMAAGWIFKSSYQYSKQ